ncbi:MAG: helix-turn-helix transcriptional regulator [Phycisphaerales bacterium]|nr:helix-turn-helix transcriptional regulator [Hyphomonadaceae bacterium]
MTPWVCANCLCNESKNCGVSSRAEGLQDVALKNSSPDRQSPNAWGETFDAPPVVTSRGSALTKTALHRWTGTGAVMIQPPLDHHYLVLHLGGEKRVLRRGEGASYTSDVPDRSITLVPAGSAYRWRTEGPIDFAHFYFSPAVLDQIIIEDFDREPRAATLASPIGDIDPLLQALYGAMLDEVAAPAHAGSLYLDAMSRALLVRVVHLHGELTLRRCAVPYAIAPHKMRATLDYIAAGLADDIDIAALARVAGLSVFHFSRAFKRENGRSPYAFVLDERIKRAKFLLATTRLPLADIARQCGFNSASQFATSFRRHAGIAPSCYRRSC